MIPVSIKRCSLCLILVGSMPTVHSQVGEIGAQPTPDVPPPSQRIPVSGEFSKLIARIHPVGKHALTGFVVFERTAEGVQITAQLGGLAPGAYHAIHIHEFGDLGSDDASSAGGPFRPDEQADANPGEPLTQANMARLRADAEGNASHVFTLKGLSLDSGPKGILGRSVIVHADPAAGTNPANPGGGKLGAGVIGISRDAQPGLNRVPPVPGTGAAR